MVAIVKQTKKQKIAMYMKQPKIKLAKMLWAANEFIDSIGPIVVHDKPVNP